MEIKPYMGPEQRAYVNAHLAMEAILAEINNALPMLPERGDLVALTAYANTRERLSTEYRLVDAISEKLDARWALLDWAKEVLEQAEAGEPDLPEVLTAFDRALKYPFMLEELVGLCLTLDPSVPDAEMGER